MVRGLLILCLLFCRADGASAQDPFRNRIFYGGVTAGANFCEVIGDAYHGYHKVGFTGGALVYAKFTQGFGACLELLYTQRGSRGVRGIYSGYVGQMIEKYYLDLNYVEMPLQVMIFPGRKVIDVGAGISYSRMINMKEDVLTDQPVYINPDNHPFVRDDIAFVVSGSLRLKKGLVFNARYQRSVRPIRDQYYVPINLGSGHQYNTWFTARLVYLFPYP